MCIRCKADICAGRSGARVAPDRRPRTRCCFYVQHWTGTFVKFGRFVALVWRVNQIRRRAVREHALYGYTDVAIAKLPQDVENRLELMQDRAHLEAVRVGDG